MLRAPLPTTLNYYLAIHSNDSFWTVQKDQASLSAVLPTTPRRRWRASWAVGCDSARAVPSHPQTAAKVRGFSPIAAGFTAEADWLLEGKGFEPSVPL